MSDPVFFGIVCLVAGLLIGWVGVHLVRSGRRQRVGQEPHCLACDYNLTGNRSARCPECGLDRAVVGKRVPSWPRIIGGGIVILVALALLANSLSYSYYASRSSLYHLRPDFIVLRDLRGNDLHPRAADELRRRLAAGSLSSASIDSTRRDVIQRLQAWGPSRMIYSEVLALANALLQHPQTSPSHQQQLLGGMEQVFCIYEPSNERVHMRGDTAIRSDTRHPFISRYQLHLVAVDGQSVSEQVIDELYMVHSDGGTSWGNVGRSLPAEPAHQVRLRVTVQWYDLRQHPEANEALEQLPLRNPMFVHSEKDIELLQQWIDRFALTPLGGVESELVLSPSTAWRAVADSSTWQPVQP